MRRLRQIALFLILAAAVSAFAQIPAKHTAELDAYIEKGMRDWGIPGLSIAVVKDGEITYLKGFGVRRLGQPDKVDDHTLFGMMSTTKAMTALAIAMLVDEGKVKWDDPVSKYLPWFRMPNGWLTQEVTVRDTLRHNAGLPNADWLWLRGDLSTREILERVQYLKPAYSLRNSFIYQNIMYQVAGEVVAAASGISWAEFVKERILNPLGMMRSQATIEAMQAMEDDNVSSPHFEIDGSIRVIDDVPVDPVPAAGAAWSCASETARWLQFLLDGGRVGDKRLVSEESFRELCAPQAIISIEDEYYPTARLTKPHWITYGLGWFQQDYRGHFVAMHTGSMDGRTAILGLIPDQRLGVYVFGNVDHAEFRHALMWKVFDLYTGAPARDWSAEFLNLYGELKAKKKAEETEREAKHVADTKSSLAREAYAGTYTHPAWGDIVISLENNALIVRFGTGAENTGTLLHWHYDTFRTRLGDGRYGWTYLQFSLGTDGHVAQVKFGDAADNTFTRKKS